MWNSGVAASGWSWPRAAVAAVITAVAVGVPTSVIDTPYFTRMTPVQWWNYPTLALTVVLTAVWAGIRGRRTARAAGSTSGVLTAIGSALAIGCPVCNKLVVGLLGVSGALGVWAPIQPVLAVLSVGALLTAVIIRWRGRGCDEQSCTQTPAVPGSIDKVASLSR
jgi:hypothetical protein